MQELTHKLAKMSGIAYTEPNIAKHEFNQLGIHIVNLSIIQAPSVILSGTLKNW